MFPSGLFILNTYPAAGEQMNKKAVSRGFFSCVRLGLLVPEWPRKSAYKREEALILCTFMPNRRLSRGSAGGCGNGNGQKLRSTPSLLRPLPHKKQWIIIRRLSNQIWCKAECDQRNMCKIIQNWSKCRSSTSATIKAKAIFNTLLHPAPV